MFLQYSTAVYNYLMIHKLYAAYDLPFSHDVCHLFEHLANRRFALELAKRGESRAFIGFIDATTSGSSVFFDTRFHDANIARLFESVLSDRQPFDEQMVNQAIKHIETEMKSIAHVQKMTALTNQLSACQAAFCGVDSQAKTSSPAKSPLKFQSGPKSFIDVAITTEILDASDEMTAAFFCLANVLADLIYEANFDLLPMCPTSPSQFTAYQDGSAITQIYSVHSSKNWQNIADTAENYLRSFDISKHAGSLASIAELFRTHPSYTAAPLYFYRKTEIPADCESLASSITPDRLQKILRQAKISVNEAASYITN